MDVLEQDNEGITEMIADRAIQEEQRQEEQKKEQKVKTKRYNLILPYSLYDQVQEIAEEEDTSVLELLKRFIRIGLIITKILQSHNSTLIIREEEGRERELVLV